MPKSLEQLKSQLSAIEPDIGTYDGIDASDIPLLEQLLHGDEAWMAARAIFALSRIPDANVQTILLNASADSRREVRVATAASVRNLPPLDASTILNDLLIDKDSGVRKFAIKSVSSVHESSVHEILRNIVSRDPVPAIREIARKQVRELRL